MTGTLCPLQKNLRVCHDQQRPTTQARRIAGNDRLCHGIQISFIAIDTYKHKRAIAYQHCLSASSQVHSNSVFRHLGGKKNPQRVCPYGVQLPPCCCSKYKAHFEEMAHNHGNVPTISYSPLLGGEFNYTPCMCDDIKFDRSGEHSCKMFRACLVKSSNIHLIPGQRYAFGNASSS